ncbi:replicative DNA helicase [Desulfofundulus salinus]|uniref:Replicative DNA helicase n=1 Tax=Desulfofundulus salinus TaxID=2419843 RepID=A0A494WW51_9FIRM|nr:replicative DNA helicase [Desulfofundulus salinum]RKO67153.1 replicative DNA helicase [Desulfofundulus salinum]
MGKRVPPQSIDAEQYVLGSCLLSAEVVDAVSEILTSDDFYRADHKQIFQAILDLYQAGKPVDLISLTEELRSRGVLDRVGGVTYIASLPNHVESPLLARHHAELVREKAILRAVLSRCHHLVERIYAGTLDGKEAMQDLQRAALELSEQDKQNAGLQPIRPLLQGAVAGIEERYRNKGKLPGLSTGLADLDKFTGGLRKGDLILIAARPSMGKTSLCDQIAVEVARSGGVVALFTTEVRGTRVAEKIIIQTARLNGHAIRIGYLGENEWSGVCDASAKLSSIKLYVDDHPHPTPAHIRAQVHKLNAKHGRVDLVVVDYIGQLDPGKKVDTRVRELAEITRSLKAMAKDFNCPVIAASQLNRAVEAQGEKRPTLSDLRDSGDLEQDSDLVLLLWRPEFYNPLDRPGMAEIIIAKQREGPTGSIWVAFVKEHTRFHDLAGEAGEVADALPKKSKAGKRNLKLV